jgi:hypothetical protein
MADVLLNTAWLALSAVIMVKVLSGGNTANISRIHLLILLTCVAALLFPIVSATDDTRAIQWTAEDSTVTKSLSESSPDLSVPHTNFLLGHPVSCFTVEPDWQGETSCTPAALHRASAVAVSLNADRAPPLS